MHEEPIMHEEFPMHGGHPSHEGTSSQGGPPIWCFYYFGKLNESMVRIKKCQEQIIQTQEKHEEYIDRLGDFYENLSEQQNVFNQQYTNQMAEVEARLEGLWVHVEPYPPHPPYAPRETPPRPPFYRDPPY